MIRELGAMRFKMGISGGFLRRRIPSHDDFVRISGDDEVSGAIDDAGEVQLHSSHFFPELQQVRDIVHDQDAAARASEQLQWTNAIRIDPQRNSRRSIGHALTMQCPTRRNDLA